MAHIKGKTYMEKKWQISEWSEAERWHLSFKLVFWLLRVNDKLGGGKGGQHPHGTIQGYF